MGHPRDTHTGSNRENEYKQGRQVRNTGIQLTHFVGNRSRFYIFVLGETQQKPEIGKGKEHRGAPLTDKGNGNAGQGQCAHSTGEDEKSLKAQYGGQTSGQQNTFDAMVLQRDAEPTQDQHQVRGNDKQSANPSHLLDYDGEEHIRVSGGNDIAAPLA